MSQIRYDGDDGVARHLRQRFLVWTMAIASSLTTTGLVTLPPSAAWAQDDSATSTDDTVEEKKFDRTEFNQLLRDREFALAAEKLDKVLADDPVNPLYNSMNNSLAVSMATAEPQAAVERLQRQFRALLAVDVLDAQQARMLASTTGLMTNFMRDAEPLAKLSLIDEASAKLEASGESGRESLLTLGMTKARMHILAGQHEEAKNLLDPVLAAAREKLDPDNTQGVQAFLSTMANYSSMFANHYPEEVAAIDAEAEKLATALIQRESATAADFQPLLTLKTRRVMELRSSEPAAAMAILDELDASLAPLKDRVPEEQSAAIIRYERQITSLRSQLEAAVKREQLIGTKAPALDAAHFVAMDPTSMEDLKGKVVLLDFWAVWCGPCIATFPHLIEWQEKYSEQGLVIIGVTKFYGYDWDEAASRAVKGEEGQVAAEAELAMLEKFREAYELQHGFIVTPEGSEYSSQFQVTGIPQAVLLDKEGAIRMIRVGSGQANAEALEAEIKALLESGDTN